MCYACQVYDFYEVVMMGKYNLNDLKPFVNSSEHISGTGDMNDFNGYLKSITNGN